MSNMRNLLEKMDQFAGQSVGQKPGDQVRGTERATKKKSGEHPFKGRLVGGCEESAGSLLKELQQELNRPAATARRDLFREFAEFKQGVTEGPLNEFAPSPGYGDNGGAENMPLEDIAKAIMLHIGDEFTVEKGKRRDQPSYKFTPKDPTKFGHARIWCMYDHYGGEYPTYNTTLFKYTMGHDGRLLATGYTTESAIAKNNQNALKTAELVYNNTDGAFKQGVTEEDAWHSSEDAPQDAWHSSQDAPQDAWHSTTSESQNNPADAVSMDIPLLIRIMEYAREDAQTDQDLHRVAERLIAMSADGSTLGMDQYDAIVGQAALDEEIAAPVTGAAVTPGATAPAANPAAMAQMKAQQLKTLAAQKKTTQDQIKQTQDQLNSLRKQLASLSNPANIAMPGVTGTAE